MVRRAAVVALLAVLCLSALAATAEARGVRLRLAGADPARVLRTGVLRIVVTGAPGERIRLSARWARGPARVRVGRSGRAVGALALSDAGRATLRASLARCRAAGLSVRVGGGGVRRLWLPRPAGCRLHAPRAGGLYALVHPAGPPAHLRVGAAVADFTPPAHGTVPGGDPADCDPSGLFSGPRPFAFTEPYVDLGGTGSFQGPPSVTSPSPPTNAGGLTGDPYVDCNHNGRWDGNLLGGGATDPRFYDHVADPVGARAMVVSNGRRTIAVEVVDQEGLFNVYQQRIRDQVTADGVHLDGIFISATHDESAPDSLGLGGVNATTSGVNDLFVQWLVARSAQAIEAAYRAMRPAVVRYAEALEPANVRQCWSSYPFVDDQRMPVLQAVGDDGRPIVTLADVSQHAETLGFNADPVQSRWISADWVGSFRDALQSRYGGVSIEMAGSVGSVESPEVYPGPVSRVPEHTIDAQHPAGCRTLFTVAGQDDAKGVGHVPLGYSGETAAFGQDMAAAVAHAIDTGAVSSTSDEIWGRRTDVCIPLQNELFAAAEAAGVFAQRPGYSSDCSSAFPVLPNGSSTGVSLLSQVAAFQIGDGEFAAVPGEVFPFTFLRGFQGPQDMPDPSAPLAPWLMPHMHAAFRFIDGLAEDMVGYIFPPGNAVGIPTTSNPLPSGPDRFGCPHSDDAEAASAQTGMIVGQALLGLLDGGAGAGPAETVAAGRYVMPDGSLSRDPLGGPELKCSTDSAFHRAGPAVAVQLADGAVVHPVAWMGLDGLPQAAPDRDTRGIIESTGRRLWLDVYPDLPAR